MTPERVNKWNLYGENKYRTKNACEGENHRLNNMVEKKPSGMKLLYLLQKEENINSIKYTKYFRSIVLSHKEKHKKKK